MSMSSLSEDDDSGPSLKELVTKNLETNGILGKLQAQLRASVFLILEEEFKEKNIPLINQKSQQLLSSPIGELAVAIIQDFLQCLSLEFTLAVFCPEAKSTLLEKSTNRNNLNKKFSSNFISDKKDEEYPFLFKLIEETQNREGKKLEKNGFSLSQSPSKVPEPSPNDPTNRINPELAAVKEIDRSDTKLSRDSLGNQKEEGKSVESLKENSQNDTRQATDEKKTDLSENITNGTSESTPTPSNESSKNEDSEPSSQASSSTISGKDTQSGVDMEYEDEVFSSLSDVKNLQHEETGEKVSQKEPKVTEVTKGEKENEVKTTDEDKTEIEEEDIEEDFSIDDLISSNSGESNETKDSTLSKDHNSVADYEESL